ncbi:MAG TPA: glycoside hydrolase family 3 N-terminal domain-containing protein [Candidatus Limnocylindria bacterium]|nr:glycoside hydrolase family 3 N-terminal domain-containing protein [Candidatus Limnocylindria bacterium]
MRTLSRRAFLERAAIGAIGLVAAACGVEVVTPTTPTAPSGAPSLPAMAPSPPPTPVASSVAPLRDKIARLLLVGFRGTTIDEAAATVADIRERKLGGVLLFDVDQPTGGVRNVVDSHQVAALTAALQEAAGGDLIIATDEEGGRVARLDQRHGFPATRSAAELGRIGDPEVTRQAARALAETLRAAGVNLNLAPVADLDLNPNNPAIGALDRSFGADPSAVVAHVHAFVAGHREVGVGTAIKHFPGQGSATADTHAGFVDVTDTWSRTELEPFARLVEDGVARAVMTAHVFAAQLDADVPATLSPAVIGSLLRGELGFDGVVISDDLQMGAIREQYGYEDALLRSLRAGIDLLLIANQQVFVAEVVEQTITAIEGFVTDGSLSVDVIDAAEDRVAALRRSITD